MRNRLAARIPYLGGNFTVSKVGIDRNSTSFLAIAGIIAFTLFRFPPELYPFYPRCPIHEYLHIDCPGCGGTRAISALLHGQFFTALHLNALVVLVLLPLAAIYALSCVHCSRKSELFLWPRIPRPVTIGLVLLASVFTLLRNL